MIVALIATVVFFILHAVFSGTRDGYLLLHINEYRYTSKGHSEVKANVYNKNWHLFSMLEAILVYLFFAGTAIFFVGIYPAVVLMAIATSIRMLLFDFSIYHTAGLGIDYYPTKNGSWDLWDGLILFLKDYGISQYSFKISVFISFILLYLLTCI